MRGKSGNPPNHHHHTHTHAHTRKHTYSVQTDSRVIIRYLTEQNVFIYEHVCDYILLQLSLNVHAFRPLVRGRLLYRQNIIHYDA